jgi:hypothetical protein
MGPTKIVGGTVGYFEVIFTETGNSIAFNTAPGTINFLKKHLLGIITGITMGDRMFYLDGTTWLIDCKSKIAAALNISC